MIKVTEKNRRYLLRIESCIRTIIDVKRALENLPLDLRVLDGVKGIEHLTRKIDPESISEAEVFLLEEATNKLMQELKPLWESDSGRLIYKEAIH